MTGLRGIHTTNLRVVVTLLIVLATTLRYLTDGWEPSGEWLAFLAAMSGLDIAQFGVKRFTHRADGADGRGVGGSASSANGISP